MKTNNRSNSEMARAITLISVAMLALLSPSCIFAAADKTTKATSNGVTAGAQEDSEVQAFIDSDIAKLKSTHKEDREQALSVLGRGVYINMDRNKIRKPLLEKTKKQLFFN